MNFVNLKILVDWITCQHISYGYDFTGVAKLTVRIAPIVPQPIRTGGNFQEFTI